MQVARPALTVYSFTLRELPEDAASRADSYLRGLWAACGKGGLDMNAPLSRGDQPHEVGVLVTADEEGGPTESMGFERVNGRRDAANKQRVYEAFLFTSGDATGFAAMLAPNRMVDSLTTWRNLLHEWRQAMSELSQRPLAEALLGEALVFSAICDPVTIERDEVVAALPPSGSTKWYYEAESGAHLWEAEEVEGRRYLGVLVPASPVTSERAVQESDDELTRWIWADPETGLSRFARYLLDAAKLRYYGRLFYSELPAIRQQRRRVDRALDHVLELHAEGGEAVDPDELLDHHKELSSARAASASARFSLTYLRALKETVAIARANVDLFKPAPHGEWQDDGKSIFAHDVALAERLTYQISHELAYGEAVLERSHEAQELTALRLEQSAQDHARKQTQLGLLQSSLLGALLALVAAVQALGLEVPLRSSAEWPLATFFAALALAVPSLVLRWHERYRPADYLSGATLGATGLWLAIELTWPSSPIPAEWLLVAVGGVLGFLLPIAVDIVCGRRERPWT